VTGTQIPNPTGSGAPATASGTSVTESGLHVVFGAGRVGRSLAAQIAGPVLPVRGVSLHRPSALTTTTNAEARFAAAKINLAGRPPRAAATTIWSVESQEARCKLSWPVLCGACSASGPGAGAIAPEGSPPCRNALLSGTQTMGQMIA